MKAGSAIYFMLFKIKQVLIKKFCTINSKYFCQKYFNIRPAAKELPDLLDNKYSQ